MYHVYCTAANSTEYNKFNEHGPKGINVVERSLLIKGGAGINKRHVQTPLGVHTIISDEDYEWLKNDYHFKQQIKDGYIVVKKQKVDSEVVAADMVTHNQKTDACPIVPQDFNDKPAGDGLTAVTPRVNKSKAA
jgi:hypothetical protein